jgi:hypothetical protein
MMGDDPDGDLEGGDDDGPSRTLESWCAAARLTVADGDLCAVRLASGRCAAVMRALGTVVSRRPPPGDDGGAVSVRIRLYDPIGAALESACRRDRPEVVRAIVRFASPWFFVWAGAGGRHGATQTLWSRGRGGDDREDGGCDAAGKDADDDPPLAASAHGIRAVAPQASGLWLAQAMWGAAADHDAVRVAAWLDEVAMGGRGAAARVDRCARAAIAGTRSAREWAERAARAGSVRVLAGFLGKLAPNEIECALVRAARAGRARACALCFEALAERREAGAAGDPREVEARAVALATRTAEAAVRGRHPCAVLDWLEERVPAYRPDREHLLRAAVEVGHRCGRGALALVVRWRNETMADARCREHAACAVARAACAGHLRLADVAVALLTPLITDADHVGRADPWSEASLDAAVSGLTDRPPLDTLALLCALALRRGRGDGSLPLGPSTTDRGADPVAVAPGGDDWWMPQASCAAWAPWIAPSPLPAAWVCFTVERVPAPDRATALRLAGWLQRAGLAVA